METITIEAAAREVGKKAARAVRRAGNVPCVLYGHHTEPVAFQVHELALRPLIFTSDLHLVDVKVEGQSWNCVVKDVEFHPVTDRPIHADFQVLESNEELTLMVPIQYHGTPVGQKDGGDTQYLTHELEITCLPKNIPSHIDIDIAELSIGDAIHVGDLSIEGVSFTAAPEQTVVTVVPPRIVAAEEEEEAAVEEAGEASAEGEGVE